MHWRQDAFYSTSFTSGTTGLYANWWDLVLVNAPAYGGDSGGTVWNVKNGNWYAGILKGSSAGNTRFMATHISTVRNRWSWLDAPVNMF